MLDSMLLSATMSICTIKNIREILRVIASRASTRAGTEHLDASLTNS